MPDQAPNIFQQLAAGQNSDATAAPPASTPQPVVQKMDASAQQSSPNIFQQLASGQNPDRQTTPQPALQTATPSLADQVNEVGDNVAKGFGKGVLQTTTGLGHIIHNVGEYIHPGLGEAIIPQSGLTAEQDMAQTHGTAQAAGAGAESIAEFLLGDEALKGLSMADKYAQVAKTMKMAEQSPRMMKALQIGANAARAGVVGAAEAGAKTGGDVGAVEKGAALGAGGVAALGGLGVAGSEIGKGATAARQAVRNYTSVEALQPELQNSITSAIQKTAAEHGITIPEGTTVRDAAQNLSDAVRAKAHGLYQSLDTALGGTRFQSFQEAVDNVQKAIRDEAGIDPAKDKLLQTRLADAKAAKDAAVEQAEANGVPKTTIDTADRLHQQSMALQDVSKAVRKATDVHPSQLAAGADLTTATNVRTKPLFSKLQELATPNPRYPGTPSRLVQAIGEDRAAQLLHDVDQAHLAALKIVERNAALAKYAKIGAGALGIGGGYEAVRGILGGK